MPTRKTRKPLKKKAAPTDKTAKPTPVASAPETKQAPKPATGKDIASIPRMSITQEIALADVRYGFARSGFFKQVHYNPDDLIGRKGIKVYIEMRRDEQIKAALLTKKMAIIASGVEVVIDDEERAEDEVLEEQKKFIEFNLNEMEGTIESYMLDALTAHDFGFSLTEPTYKRIEYGEFKGKYGWKALKVRRPEQIEFETDQFGNLTKDGILQGTERMPADRFAIFTYRKEFGNLYGNSDLRECYRPFFVKDQLIKFMAMAMERYGMPIPVAKSEQTLDDETKALLLQIINNIQTRTGIIIPSWIELTFENPGEGAQTAYPPIFKQLDQWIAMAILMPSLIGAGGGKEDVGSNARAETEMNTFLWVVELARNALQEFMNDRLVKVLIDLNYTVEDGIYPKLKFRELTHERKMEILDRLTALITGQIITKTPDIEDFARDSLSLQELPEDEVSVGTREAQELAMQDQVKQAGEMAKVNPAVPPAPSTKDKGPERNPFQKKPAQFARNYHGEGSHDEKDHGNRSGPVINPNKHAQMSFVRHAKSLGYSHKVYGDDAYTKSRSPQSPIIRLLGAKNSKVQIFEHGKGRYEIDLLPLDDPQIVKEIEETKKRGYAQRDDLPRTPGSHLFAGQNDAPRDFDEKCLNSMIKRGQALGYDEEALNFAAGFMSAPASKYQSLNEMAQRGEALAMDQKTIEFAIGFLCESLDAEKREKEKEKAKKFHGDHNQEDHGNWADDWKDPPRDTDEQDGYVRKRSVEARDIVDGAAFHNPALGSISVRVGKGKIVARDAHDGNWSDEFKTPEELAEWLEDNGYKPLGKYAFDPNQPRDEIGRWTDDGGGAAAHKSITDVISRTTETNPFKDVNQDGVTDAARVGVGGFEVPPPPAELPRVPNLTADERAVEDKFAEAFEADPQGMTAAYMAQVQASGTPNTFSTDDAKMLSPDYAKDKDSRAIYNVAVHQTANAIAKRAFLEYIDNLPADKKTILVTAGGVAAGKGYALDHVDDVHNVVEKVGAVWDTAGEQNSTELPWVLSEARKRGITPIFAYVDADPTETFSRVVSRAQKSGRMVDADLFADSYAVGARNFLAFSHNYKDQAKFIYLSNRGEPKRLDYFPSAALIDREVVYNAARNHIREKSSELSAPVLRGATIGRRIWHKSI